LSIAILRNMHEIDGVDGDIERIVIYFEESHFHSVLVPKLQEIQELLFGTLHSNKKHTIQCLMVQNGGDDVETNNRCYDFLSQYLEGSQDTIKQFSFMSSMEEFQ